MRKHHLIQTLVVALLLAAIPAWAEKIVIGPYPNYKGIQQVIGLVVIPTTNSVAINDPISGSSYTIQSYGGQEYMVNMSVPVFAASYVAFESSLDQPFNPGTDSLTFTEIFAFDTQPDLPLPQVPFLNGFLPGPPPYPQIQPVGPAYFIGPTEVPYYAEYSSVLPIMALATLPELDGYDVSLFGGDPECIVFVSQATVPAAEFIQSGFVFSFDYQNYTYVGDIDPEYPFEHRWTLNISQWNPQVAFVSDLEVEGPTIIPGYLEIIPPANWGVSEYIIGRYGYQANPGAEFTNVGTYTDWIVRGKTPYVEPGYAYLTQNGSQVSTMIETQVVGQPFDFTFEYQGYNEVGGEYPFEHRWTLNISQWNPQVDYISDLEVEGPTIIPGYLEIIPPANWGVSEYIIGRYGYQANPGAEFTNVGTYTDWIVRGKTPYVEPGYAYLTRSGSQVSAKVPTMVPAGQVQEFEFSYDYLGYVEPDDPAWSGPVNPEYPYQHSWALEIMQWNPQVPSVSDLDVEGPHVIPGYIEVVPPENWHSSETWYFGRYSYEANPGNEITAGGGTYGWKVNAKTPYVEPGYAFLTSGGQRVSARMPTEVVGQLPQCGDQGYLAADINRDCHVNLMDLAMMAQQWLACTMPGETGCLVSEPTIVGLGMAFDDLADGPAKILYLYDDSNLGTLEAGDEIIEYRGLPITSGADLMAAIDSLPMLVQDELVPVSLIRDSQTISVVAAAATISAEAVDVSPCSGKRCVRIQISGGGTLQDQFYCDCVTPASPETTCQLIQVKTTDKEGKTVAISSWCQDNAGGKCEETAKGH